MSPPGTPPPASPASPKGSPASPSSSRNGASNGIKAIFCVTLMLFTAASLYVAVTWNFNGFPDRPNADIPAASLELSRERHLHEEQRLPWRIREPKPWRLRPQQSYVAVPDEDDESKDAEQNEEEKKEVSKKEDVPATKPVEKKEVKEVNKETPRQQQDLPSKNSTNTLHIPTKRTSNATKTIKTLASSSVKPEKIEQAKMELKKRVRAKVQAAKNQTLTNLSEKTPEITKLATATNKTDTHQAKTETKKKNKPLNILLLFADDMRHDSLGSASNGLVKTPFFDQLATEGMRFTHNCVTTSVCWVSRATLYTGQYVSRHKSTEPTKPEFYAGWNKTFPYLLREAGYYFGHVGKWHFKDFHEIIKPQLDWERFYYGRHWWQERGGPIHTTKRNEIDAIQFLNERPKDKPFCLTVCFFTPHAHDGEPEQYLPQNESMALYVNDTIPVAPSATDEAWKKMPHFFTDKNEGRNRYYWRFDTPEKHQSMMKNYYRLISEIDSTSGRIVQELKDQGILDETLIIFTTDNGYFHAEHGLADKFYPYQESIRVPLIVRDPRMKPSKVGKLSDEFTLNIDLAPTILGAAGIPKPDVMQGNDFSPLYTVEGETNSRRWRKEFFYEHPVHLREDIIPASEALVRKDYKYMLWPDFHVEQLFDLKNDTYELNDLINSTSHKELLGELRSRFQLLKKLAK